MAEEQEEEFDAEAFINSINQNLDFNLDEDGEGDRVDQ